MLSDRLRPLLLAMAFGSSIVGCADVDDDDSDMVDSEEDDSELKKSPNGTLQIYSSNTHHMSQPGRDSFEVTDFRQLVHYMKEQKYSPDFIMLSEVGRNNEVPSQPCKVFVNYLEKTLSKKGKQKYECVQTAGATDKLNNSGGGSAIVYRSRFKPLERKALTNFKFENDKCVNPGPNQPSTTLIQKFQDGNRTITLAPLHLVGPDPAGSNQYGRDCSDKNLAIIAAEMEKMGGDIKVIGGDMNHADAERRMENGAVVHVKWEGGYAQTNAYLAKEFSPNGGYRDPWFKDCGGKCGVKASGSKKYSAEQHQCISACIAETTSFSRIDWLVAKGASTIRENYSIPFAEARDAYVRQTGDANAVEKYSDHLAQRMRVVY